MMQGQIVSTIVKLIETPGYAVSFTRSVAVWDPTVAAFVVKTVIKPLELTVSSDVVSAVAPPEAESLIE